LSTLYDVATVPVMYSGIRFMSTLVQCCKGGRRSKQQQQQQRGEGRHALAPKTRLSPCWL
jgi:hypothetical protein